MDSTIMNWGFEFCEEGHNQCAGQSILLGKASGAWNTGMHIDAVGAFNDPARVVGDVYKVFNTSPPINKTFVTILRAMGLTQTQIEAPSGTVGFGEYGTSSVSGNDHRTSGWGFSTENSARFLTDTEKRKPLPILKA